MKIVKLTEQEIKNLLVFLTGDGRTQLTGNEAFEFVSIVNKISNAESEVIELPHQE